MEHGHYTNSDWEVNLSGGGAGCTEVRFWLGWAVFDHRGILLRKISWGLVLGRCAILGVRGLIYALSFPSAFAITSQTQTKFFLGEISKTRSISWL